MLINREELKRNAENLLNILEEQKVYSVADLNRLLKKRVQVGASDFVEFSLRPSNFRTRAYTISYIVPYIQGISLEIKINPRLNYSQIIIKSENEIGDYKSFSYDDFGNLILNKKLETTEVREIKKEIERLRDY